MASVGFLRTRLEGDAPVKPFLDMIQSDTTRMNDLINNLLDLTCPIQMDVQPYRVTTILEDAIRSLQEETRAHRATITLTNEGGLSPLRADGQMLRKAFGALICNAIESREADNNIRIVVKQESGLQSVHLHDNGIGIPAGDLAKIFEPFFSTRPKKAGLGLCVADHAIHAHQGRISVHSQEGVGTDVLVTLPILP